MRRFAAVHDLHAVQRCERRRGDVPAKRNSTVRGAARRRPSTVSVTTRPPFFDDRDAVDESLHLVEFVRGEEHRAALGDGLPDQVLELVLQQRIQAGGRFVEHEQVGLVHECEHQADLLPIAFRQCPRRAIEIGGEPLDELVAVAEVTQPSCPRQPVEVLAAGQAGVEGELARQVADTAMNRDRVAARVEFEHSHAAGAGPVQPEQ